MVVNHQPSFWNNTLHTAWYHPDDDHSQNILEGLLSPILAFYSAMNLDKWDFSLAKIFKLMNRLDNAEAGRKFNLDIHLKNQEFSVLTLFEGQNFC